jgi:hypothetical protein
MLLATAWVLAASSAGRIKINNKTAMQTNPHMPKTMA